VCGFFGIDYMPEMLDVGRSHEAQQISQLSALWSSNCFPPILANKDKFKQQLTSGEIETIETLTRDYMVRYGYEFMTAANATITGPMLRQAKERSDAGRLRAWQELERRNHRDFVLRRFRANYLESVRHRLESSRTDW
jgi:hypothetical protein